MVATGLAFASPASAAAEICNSNAGVLAWANPNGTGTDSINVPVKSTGSQLCHMAKGAKHSGVRVLQQNLNSCYGAGLVADGDYGDLTANALASAQRKAGIADDGLYGPDSRRNLKWVHLDSGSCFKDVRYLG